MPTTLAAVVFFFLLAAPGLVEDLLRAKRVAFREEESTFREIGRIVLASTVYVVVATLVVLVAAAVSPYFTWAGLSQDFESRVMAGRFNLALVLTGMLIVGLACLLAWLKHRWLIRPGSKKGADEQEGAMLQLATAWDQLLRMWVPAGYRPMARVVTDAGTYRGLVHSYTQANKVNDRELVLRAPILLETDAGLRTVHANWALMSFSAEKITSLSVAMLPPDAMDPEYLRELDWLNSDEQEERS